MAAHHKKQETQARNFICSTDFVAVVPDSLLLSRSVRVTILPFHFAQLCKDKKQREKNNKTKSKQMHCGSLWMNPNVKEAPDVPLL